MNLELIFIKFILNIDFYKKYRNYININKDNKELYNLYCLLDDIINKYNRTVLLEEYKLLVLNTYPDYSEMVKQLEEVEVGEDMVSDLLKEAKNRSIAYDLALLSLEVSEGKNDPSTLVEKVSEFDQPVLLSEEEEFITDDLEQLYNETTGKPGLRWRLSSLNKSLGSLRKGDFGFIFARPETGKTTFLASEVSFFAEQTDSPILWFNNEEQGNKVKIRIMQASLGRELISLYKDRKKSYNDYITLTKGNIKLKDNSSIHKRQVELLCKQYKPSLLIFDQIDKIKGFNNDREDLRLGSIYIWARELAKEYCPVIAVCQSDVTGEGKRWLTMDNVANAKTSKQAEADWILGIGKTHDQGLEYVRYLHLSKNKLAGDEDSEPEMRHGKIECIIKPEIARYTDYEY